MIYLRFCICVDFSVTIVGRTRAGAGARTLWIIMEGKPGGTRCCAVFGVLVYFCGYDYDIDQYPVEFNYSIIC